MRQLLIIFVIIACSLSSVAQNEKIWRPYLVQQQIDTSDFSAPGFKHIVSFAGDSMAGLIDICVFRLSENGTLIHPSEEFPTMDFFHAACQTYFNRDTLEFRTGIGFFGGLGLALKIQGGKFSATAIVSTDGAEVLKHHTTDERYAAYLVLKPVTESLRIAGDGRIEKGKQMVAEYEAEYLPYYENKGQSELKYSNKIRVVFRITPVMGF